MTRSNAAPATLALLAFAPAWNAASANDPIEIVLLEGDLVPGVGHVTSMFDASVDDTGSWILHCETDGPFNQSRVLVRDGSLMLQEGDPLGPGSFDSAAYLVHLDGAGRSVALLRHQYQLPLIPNGVYVGTQLMLFPGDPVGAPGVGLGSTYGEIEYVTASGVAPNGDGVALIQAMIEDPSSSPFWALVVVTYDDAGNLLSEEIRVRLGDVPLGLTAPLSFFGIGVPFFQAVNSAGDVLYWAKISTSNWCDYGVFLNLAPLAFAGWPTPWGGTWDCNGGLGAQVGLNDHGDFAFTGVEKDVGFGEKVALVVNGEPFVREGDALGAIAPHGLASVAATELSLDGEGNPLWYGTWDPVGGRSGLFLGKTLLVEYGVTPVGPHLIAGFGGYVGTLDMSPNGDYVLLAVSLETGQQALLRIDTRQVPRSYCTAGKSAAGCQAGISATGTASASAPSGFSLLAAVEGQKDGLFFFGTNGKQANPWGNGTSYQCVVPPVVRTPTMSGVGTIGLCDGSFALDLNALWCPSCPKPAKNPGAAAVVQAQLWYRDPL